MHVAPIMKELLHRKKNDKYFKWFFCDAHNVTGCRCDLSFEIVSPKFLHFNISSLKGVIPRSSGVHLRTDEEMMIVCFLHIESVFVKIGEIIIERGEDRPIPAEQLSAIVMAAEIGRNQYLLPPILPNNFYPRSQELPPVADFVASLYRMWDIEMFAHFGYDIKDWLSRIFMRSQIPGLSTGYSGFDVLNDDEQDPEILWLREHSAFNRAFGGRKLSDGMYHPHTMLSSANMYPMKLPTLVRKFDKEPNLNLKQSTVLRDNMEVALEMFYEAMDVKKYFGSQRWEFTEDAVMAIQTPLTSSSGHRPGPNISKIIDGVKYEARVTGTKGVTSEYAKQVYVDAYENFERTGELKLPMSLYNIAVKTEVFNSFDLETEAEILKMEGKCREFFIASVLNFIVSYSVNEFRHGIERGPVIKIGFKWSRGGAYHLAKQLLYDHKKNALG
jgi:hypothetical protein